jgi:hypothetical protein
MNLWRGFNFHKVWGEKKKTLDIFFRILTLHLDVTKVIYSLMNARKRIVLKTVLKFTLKQLRYLLPNSATHTHTHQQGPTNICSHITTELITHRCTIINHFNKV